jgi:tetratricopeptide (TPR) repeat protein
MMPAAKSRRTAAVALSCCLVLSAPLSFAADTIEVSASADQQQFLADAESMLASGQSAAAFTLLGTREAELAGNPYYDYLFGVAALDSGHHGEAIFSLRRSLSVAPDFSGARMELARAYFDSGNQALARPLFERLLTENPPSAVRSVITDYLAAIDARPTTTASRFDYAFDTAIGYDSNANGSTDNQQFLGFTLSPDNIKTESSFFEVGANVNWSKPTSTQFGWFAGGRAALRHNPDASFVDSTIVSGNGSMMWQRGTFFGRAGAEGYWATRDGDPNQSFIGLDTLIGNRIADNWDLTLGLRGGALRHDDAIETLDVDRMLVTAGARYRFGSPGSFGFEIISGSDSERLANSPYGNSKFGGRMTLFMPVSRNGELFASAGALTSDYDGLFFGTPRKDTQISTLLQITFRDIWIDGLSLIPRIRYVDNDSDVTLYDYGRTEVGLQLRWMPQ